MRRLRPILPTVLVALALAAPAPLGAASFTVLPTRILLETPRRTGSLTVRNEGDEPVLVQVETLGWPRATPAIETEPTRELLAVPPIFPLPPGGEQTVRVGLRREPVGPRELTYRLLLSEIPTPEDDRAGGVRFSLRFSIPVFVRPPSAAPVLAPELERAAGGWRLVLRNAGDAHTRLFDVRLLRGDGHEIPVQGDPGYLLAGEFRSFGVGGLRAGETVRAVIETESGEKTFELVVGGG